MKKLIVIFLMLNSPEILANSCNEHLSNALRNNDYRRSPVDGEAKIGMVDYKLINQLLMALQRAVVDDHPRPDGFEAELASATHSDSPVGGVRITGTIRWPGHPLAGHEVELEIQRERLAVIATVRDRTSNQKFEAVMGPDDFSSVFPFQQPSGRGLLLSLSRGLEIHWDKFFPTH